MKVITLFSYKGGSGRTVASANLATSLASSKGKTGAILEPLNHKVAIIDLDVFSSGLHRVFGIKNDALKDEYSIQNYLLKHIDPTDHIRRGGLNYHHPLMEGFRNRMSAKGRCNESFTLFPAKSDPKSFTVQKFHENLLLELIIELENQDFEYVVLDGEAGKRSMADIAIRLSDVVLMLFRMTWQHIDGTMGAAYEYAEQYPSKHFYLVPTCVPLVGKEHGIYQENGPGVQELLELTEVLPTDSGLNEYAQEHKFKGKDKKEPGPGYFWTDGRLCIHESLILKGGERIIGFEHLIPPDPAASNYYELARKISRLHPPNE
jgi:MinD-like ATPase involved in chromosome partitioning or flagellar assembly